MMKLHKKVIMLSVAFIAAVMGGSLFARCTSCAEKIAIKQSIAAALAASMANKPSNKPSGKHIDTLEDIAESQEEEQAYCEPCATGEGDCDNKKCPCGEKMTRAERESMTDNDLCSSCELKEVKCLFESLMTKNTACCKMINNKLKDQGHDAKRCCKKIRNELEEIEDLIISQTDEAATCCSVTEALILSQTDQAAVCCSVIESLIVSQTDDCCASLQSRLDVLEFNMSITDAQIIATLSIILGCACG